MTVLVLVVLLAANCTVRQVRTVTPPEKARRLDPGALWLKAHMLNGQVYVLEKWFVNEKERRVSGTGRVLGINRQALEYGKFNFPLDSVALFETNDLSPSPSIAAMGLITAASLAFTVYCVTNPKACFGSCPTFYISDGERPTLQAEGFSSSVAPALEATDVDALFLARPSGPEVHLTMTNEALETHVVREVSLLAVKRRPGGRVVYDIDDHYRHVSRFTEPTTCRAPEGDCRETVRSFDGRFRTSRTDSVDLATDETIMLEFEPIPDGEIGLVIASRQSLLSTYLFYQSLAFLGSQAGSFLAELGRQPAGARARVGGIGEILGGIDIQTRDATGEWITRGTVRETGPLASDTRLVKLPRTDSDRLQVRLRMKRGYWRIDYLALVAIGEQAPLQRLAPSTIEIGEDMEPRSPSDLLDPDRYLVTFPGDAVQLTYTLPGPAAEYELFLESRGYYLEWMRDAWIAEEDLTRAAQILIDPKQALKAMAPEFKAVEADMENTFWNSRYVDGQK